VAELYEEQVEEEEEEGDTQQFSPDRQKFEDYLAKKKRCVLGVTTLCAFLYFLFSAIINPIFYIIEIFCFDIGRVLS